MGKGRIAQVGALVLTGFMCAVCSPPPDRIAAPPETSPLSHEAVGYAVISVSYARVLSEPEEEAVSLGVVSGGTVVTVLERRLILKNRTPASGGERSGNTPDPEAAYWLLTEGSHKGWIKAGQAFIYESEEKARTAAAGF